MKFNKNKILNFRTECVLCDSKKLTPVLKFGKTPLANSYPSNKKERELYFSLTNMLCNNCGHLQLKEIISSKKMFENYVYVSGTSPVLEKHFKDYAKKIVSKFKINKNDKILDIACNDGTFLKWFVKNKYKNVVGVEPAKNLRKENIKNNIDVNTLFFNHKNSYYLKKKYNSFKLITANNVCAHTPELKSFFKGIKNILGKKGVFIFEVSYLLDVYRKLTFDTIYHEHMSYHALKPILEFSNRFDLQVFDFDLVEAQGGSIRVYVCHKNDFKVKSSKINNQILIEKKYRLFSKKTYLNYRLKINNAKIKLRKIINNYKSKKLVIVGYGAPAKLTTFSHVLDINKNDLDYIIDDNNLKQGKFAPGKKIPIHKFEKVKQKTPDVILVLAWNFFESIYVNCKRRINKKIIYINPFPNIKKYK